MSIAITYNAPCVCEGALNKSKLQMMNKEKIYELTDEAETLLSDTKHFLLWKFNSTLPLIKERMSKIKALVTEAELLLLNEPTAITETALSANTMLGDSAAVVESSTIEEAAAVSSETRGVRQNEQTKELCLSCHSKVVAVKGELWCNACFSKKMTAQ